MRGESARLQQRRPPTGTTASTPVTPSTTDANDDAATDDVVAGRDLSGSGNHSTRSVSVDAPRDRVTVEDAVAMTGPGKAQLRLLWLVGVAFGAEAIQIFLFTFLRAQLQADWGISDTAIAAVPTATFFGMLVGALTLGAVADSIGRRVACLACLICCCVFTFLSAASPNFPALLLCNVLSGFGVGGGFLVPATFMELLPKTGREKWITFTYSFWSFGVLLLCLEAYLLHDHSWRFLPLVAATPMLFCVLGVAVWLPESPRFLAKSGYPGEALSVIRRVGVVNGRPLPADIVLLLDESGQPYPEKGTSAAAAAVIGGGDVQVKPPSTLPSTDEFPTADDPMVGERPVGSRVERALVKCKAAGASFALVLHPSLRKLPLSRWCVWMAAGCCYYGIAMLTSNVFLEGTRHHNATHGNASQHDNASAAAASVEGHGRAMLALAPTAGGTLIPAGPSQAPDTTSAPASNGADYLSVAICAAGELPCYFIVYFAATIWGRRRPLILLPVLAAVCLVAMHVANVERHGAEASFRDPVYVLEIAFAFCSRCFVLAQFDIVFLLSPEAYPTSVRGTGTGICSSVARLASLGTSYVAYGLGGWNPIAPIAVYSAILFASTVDAACIPVETKGQALRDSVAPNDEAPLAPGSSARSSGIPPRPTPPASV